MSEQFDQAFWDDRYRSQTALWSGAPNPQLVNEVVDLAPGLALDVGAGEGADAIWLADRGWQVTAVDISAVALERAASHVRSRADLADRIHWLRQDVLNWEPPSDHFDLVTAQYLHLPPEPRRALFERLACSVAPGGTLLLVGHHPSDMETAMPRPQMPELFFTGDDVAGQLDPTQWDIVTNAAPGRTAKHDGHPVAIRDAVLRATRQGRRL
jgi:SAM-dependent methyltransferase